MVVNFSTIARGWDTNVGDRRSAIPTEHPTTRVDRSTHMPTRIFGHSGRIH